MHGLLTTVASVLVAEGPVVGTIAVPLAHVGWWVVKALARRAVWGAGWLESVGSPKVDAPRGPVGVQDGAGEATSAGIVTESLTGRHEPPVGSDP